MSNISKLFNEILSDAKKGEIKYQEVLYGELIDCIFRMKFSINDSNYKFNFHTNDYNNLIDLLKEYVINMVNLYNINNEYEIKKILILLWSNITYSEMLDINSYVLKYILFIKNNTLLNKCGSKYIDNIGTLNYSFNKQSYKQETPYCFNAYFTNNGINYYLPRISYGIIDEKCYIYAIQNKEKNNNTFEQLQYKELVRKKLNILNKGIKEYRNVDISSLISIILFISILKENNITKFEIVTNLPIRIQNRYLVNNYKLERKSSYLSIKQIEEEKDKIKEEETRIYYNTTIRFKIVLKS